MSVGNIVGPSRRYRSRMGNGIPRWVCPSLLVILCARLKPLSLPTPTPRSPQLRDHPPWWRIVVASVDGIPTSRLDNQSAPHNGAATPAASAQPFASPSATPSSGSACSAGIYFPVRECFWFFRSTRSIDPLPWLAVTDGRGQRLSTPRYRFL
jgi:hypothetical protein